MRPPAWWPSVIARRFAALLDLGAGRIARPVDGRPRRRFPFESQLRDSLAFGRSEAYPAHSGTLTAGLLASFPRRSFAAAS